MRAAYGQVEGGVHAQRRLLGREGLASAQNVVLVARARLLVADVAQRLLAAQRRVVWLAHRQEVRRQVARHHLAGVDEDVDGEEPKGVDACGERGGLTGEEGSDCLDVGICSMSLHTHTNTRFIVSLAGTQLLPIKCFCSI